MIPAYRVHVITLNIYNFTKKNSYYYAPSKKNSSLLRPFYNTYIQN